MSAVPERDMATKASRTKAGAGEVVGQRMATLGSDMVLVRVRNSKKAATRPGDEASVLVTKAWQALKKPGISKQAVFRGSHLQVGQIYSYSVDPQDPSKIVREDAAGTRTTGRVVDGEFRVTKAA
jgi:hypothetical protein